jgi:DinB superfamily
MKIKTNQIMVKMVLDRWSSLVKICDGALDSMTDEQLQKELVPNKNRGIYLLGHLIAVHDEMILILGLGDKLYPELYEPFLKSPDRSVSEIPSAKELREFWNKQNNVLTQKFSSLQPDEWFLKHNSVSGEDFIKEPHRNRLNVLLTRTTHLSYHVGQLMLLKK